MEVGSSRRFRATTTTGGGGSDEGDMRCHGVQDVDGGVTRVVVNHRSGW
jgi:hypothetical protein